MNGMITKRDRKGNLRVHTQITQSDELKWEKPALISGNSGFLK
jgi:hypothetical protein